MVKLNILVLIKSLFHLISLLKEEDYIDYEDFTSDYTRKDGEKALKSGTIVVYSSKKIKQGTFVTPSYEEARGYAGTQNPVYSKKVSIEDIAWIDVLQGQYAKVKEPLKK